MKRSISVVIPNYNGKKLLSANLPPLYRALETSGITDYEVIVADDASADGSVGFIRNDHPEVILVENRANQGFPANANSGIRRASKDLVFIMNTDVVLTEGYFAGLLSCFDEPDAFGVMGSIIGLDSGKLQDGAKYPAYSFAGINSNINYINRVPGGGKTLSFFLSGANALVDRRKLDFLGGFDEIFGPYYSEDVDLCLRAWRVGYRCYYDPGSVCRHPNASTIGQERAGKVKVTAKRNKMLLHFIHLEGSELFCYLLLLALKFMFRAFALDLSYCRSFLHFAALTPRAVRSRAMLKGLQRQNGTSLSVGEIAGLIKKNINREGLEMF